MSKAIRASTLVLLLALTCPVYAGEYPYGSPQPSPPPVQETTTGGVMHTPALVQIALNLLALF